MACPLFDIGPTYPMLRGLSSTSSGGSASRVPLFVLIAGAKGTREKYLAYAACTSMYNTVNLGDIARQPLIHDGSGTAIR